MTDIFAKVLSNSRLMTLALGFFVFSGFLIAGCSETGEKKGTVGERAPFREMSEVASSAKVNVPEEVQEKWKAVKITVHDKEQDHKEVYTVDIGSGFKLPGSDMSLKVVSFLPDFVMNGPVMTSASNRLDNPAVKVEIRENSEVIYSGWLFSLYPETHAFQHPRYSFSLIDFIPARLTKKSTN